MSDGLNGLAREIARELARADQVVRGGPPVREGTSSRHPQHHHNLALPVDVLPNSAPGVTFTRDKARIADYIDHTLLKAEATFRDVERLCAEAAEHHFAAVCVNPVWIRECVRLLRGVDVAVATVIGFPLGASASVIKQTEAVRAVDDGATEVDMVAAIGHIKGGDWRYVADDIAAVVQGAAGRLVKVIIESSALTPVEIIKASAVAKEVGAQYVKTSTGFHPSGGATVEAVALMRLVVGDSLGVKASGGVRDCDAALKMIASGATRIGTSSGVSMAKCLGAGPLPLQDLLSFSSGHNGGCHTCSAAGTSASGSY